jgi:maleate cis-trans isomerase
MTVAIRHVGFVAPSTVRVPWDLEGLLPPGVALMAATLTVKGYKPEEFAQAAEQVHTAAALLAGEGAEAVMSAGVPLSLAVGYPADCELAARETARLGVPFTSAILPALDSLLRQGCRRVIAATAYPSFVNDQLTAYLLAAGLEPLAVKGLEMTGPRAANVVDPVRYAALGDTLLAAHPAAEAVLLSARGNLIEAAAGLQRARGLPVVIPSVEGLRWALDRMGLAPAA